MVVHREPSTSCCFPPSTQPVVETCVLIMEQHRRSRLLRLHICFHRRAGVSNACVERRFVNPALDPREHGHADASSVYHWAAVTAGRYGRGCGFLAGWLNLLAWVFGAASISFIAANLTVAMYATFHPGFVVQQWHVFVAYLVSTWLSCATVLFANKALPTIANLGMFFVIADVVITIIICSVMPHVKGTPYASNAFVWKDWENETGYSSDGFAFLAGMLNGAYALGTPDCVSHLAEELPK